MLDTSRHVTHTRRLTSGEAGVTLLLALCAGSAAHTSAQAPTALEAPVVMNWRAAEWGPPTNRPRYPAGLRNAPISTDPGTGGVTYLARFPASTRFDMHWHTHTETVVVLKGAVDIILDGTRRTANEGSYIIIPGTAHHEWRVHADTDVVLFARRDGPPDFYFVEP